MAVVVVVAVTVAVIVVVVVVDVAHCTNAVTEMPIFSME